MRETALEFGVQVFSLITVNDVHYIVYDLVNCQNMFYVVL
jgi:hypothetical protein